MLQVLGLPKINRISNWVFPEVKPVITRAIKDVVDLKSKISISSAKSLDEIGELFKIFHKGYNKENNWNNKFMLRLSALGEKKNNVRLLKNCDNEIIGGYTCRMNSCKELYINNLVIEKNANKMLKNDGVKAFDKIFNDIASVAEQKGAKTVTCAVAKDKAPLVALYKKYGLEVEDCVSIDGISFSKLDDFHKMSIPVEKLKNFI